MDYRLSTLYKRIMRFLIFLFLFLLSVPALAQEKAQEKPADVKSVSGLPIPRFVSLKSDQVHMRVGPGVDYPIDWVYTKPGLPAEVIAEYDVWRKLRDYQGTEGWVHQQHLTGRRMMIVTKPVQPLLRRMDSESPALAKISEGVVGRILECPDLTWCRVEIGGYRGYMRRDGFWGVYAQEKVE